MTGYQEILTDPSYRGQIVAMTYPEIGNYGVNAEDVESAKPQLAGFIVRNRSTSASNFRSDGNLDDYLAAAGVVGHFGHRHPGPGAANSQHGAHQGVLSTVDLNDASLVAKAKASPGLIGRDLVREVMPAAARDWNERLHTLGQAAPAGERTAPAVARRTSWRSTME